MIVTFLKVRDLKCRCNRHVLRFVLLICYCFSRLSTYLFSLASYLFYLEPEDQTDLLQLTLGIMNLL